MKFHYIEGNDHRRGQWSKWTELDGRRYLVGSSQLGSNWIVRAKDVESGEVVEDKSLHLYDNKPMQERLVQRLHDKGGAES
jgi:hypothetical protein